MPGNRLSRKHGLRALSWREAGPRRNKAGWLLRGLVQDLAAEGRTLKPYEKQRARRWCELEVIASDAIEELLAQDWPKQPNTKLWEIYHAAVNQQGRIAAELGITRATEEKVRDPAPGGSGSPAAAACSGAGRLVSIVAALPGQGFTAVVRTDHADQPVELPVVAWLVSDAGAVWPVAVNTMAAWRPSPTTSIDWSSCARLHLLTLTQSATSSC